VTQRPSPGRRALFIAVTVLTPFLLLALVEGVLRLTWADGDIPAFVATAGNSKLRTPNPRVAKRYFAGEAMPPAPPTDVFAGDKSVHTLRLFVLGESTAAGFPYPHNGTFSRIIRDALHDVLPNDSIEVVNVGIAATNSYTLVDLTNDVLAQKPDAVLIYAGHNEYYGALGVGSTIRTGSSPRLVRAALAAQRWRTVRLLRVGIDRLLAASRNRAPDDATVATFMETVAADQQIELGGRAYDAGLAQFRDNMGIVLRRFRDAHVPVFIASIASNERDQPPFVSDANAPARAAYDSARQALALGDSTAAHRLFTRARDLDVIRFRAPSALNDTLRSLAQRFDAHYVPVAERFASLSLAGTTGHELFLEHVHPNRHGYAVIAEAFTNALRDQRYLGRISAPERLAPWSDYDRRMELSPFDERIVQHTVTTITTRWPFVTRRDAQDYRGTYRPADFSDSLALLVSRGGVSWSEAKLRLAAHDDSLGAHEAALAEYRGLLRDRPFVEPGYRLVGRALLASGRAQEAVPYLERAMSLTPSAESCYLLGVIALEQKDYPRAITWLDRAVSLQPDAVASLYQLSLAFGLSHNVEAARGAAARAAQLNPRYPGLAAWMKVIGMKVP
jgi:tetratricopeptide (TPR) repeat protein